MKTLNYEDFEKKWREKAIKCGKKNRIFRDSKFLMAYIVIFTEHLFCKHHIDMGASRDDLRYAGMDKILKKTFKTIQNENIIISLIYCGANDPFNHDMAMKRDAYRTSLRLYEESQQDSDELKKMVLEKYSKDEDGWIKSIYESVPDEILAKHLIDLDRTLVLKLKEIDMISKALNKKNLDKVMMWDMKDNYKLYVEHKQEERLEEAAKETLRELRREKLK